MTQWYWDIWTQYLSEACPPRKKQFWNTGCWTRLTMHNIEENQNHVFPTLSTIYTSSDFTALLRLIHVENHNQLYIT